MSVDIAHARAAKKRVLALLSGSTKVSGVGITQVGDDFAVRVNLKEPPRDAFEVPSTVDGVVVVTEVVGPIAKRR